MASQPQGPTHALGCVLLYFLLTQCREGASPRGRPRFLRSRACRLPGSEEVTPEAGGGWGGVSHSYLAR